MSKLIIENLLSDLALKCVSKKLGQEINSDRIKSTLMAAVDQNWEIVEDILFSHDPKFSMEEYQERMAESVSHGLDTLLKDFSNKSARRSGLHRNELLAGSTREKLPPAKHGQRCE